MYYRRTKKRIPKKAKHMRPAFLVCGFLVCIVAWYLVMVTSSVGASYQLRDLADEYAVFQNEFEGLEEQLSQSASPGMLEERTKGLGLVRVAGAEYVNVSVQDSVAEAPPGQHQF